MVLTWILFILGKLIHSGQSTCLSLARSSHPCVAVFITSDKCYDNVEWVWGYRESDPLGGRIPTVHLLVLPIGHSLICALIFPRDGSIRIGVGRAGNVIGGGDWADDRIVQIVSALVPIPLGFFANPLATRLWQHVLEPLSGYLNLAIP